MLPETTETSIIEENGTLLVVPSLKEPKMLPAFFNPKGRFVRNVSIVCYNAFCKAYSKSKISFADSLAGIGARGLRVAKEVPDSETVVINDMNPRALALARKSAEMNSITEKCLFSNEEACSFLSSRRLIGGERFDIVDVDPFGTPSPFVDCALRAVGNGGLLSLAATDSAVLCGVYPQVAQMKYNGTSLRTDYSHEIGLRLIFGLAAAAAMRLETGIAPIFCHHNMHYFRAYCLVKVGNRHSRENERDMGFVKHCFSCGYRSTLGREEFFSSRLRAKQDGGDDSSLNSKNVMDFGICPSCSKRRLRYGGPLWIGKIQSREFIDKCKEFQELPMLFDPYELDLPLYYDLTTISQQMGTRTPRIDEVISKLREAGRQASRTRLNPQAIRTDAPLEEIRSAMKGLLDR